MYIYICYTCISLIFCALNTYYVKILKLYFYIMSIIVFDCIERY